MKPEFFLSFRYLTAKKRRSSISLISAISIICVALAVMVLIVVFSVLNGFHADMKSKILSKESHLLVTRPGNQTISGYHTLIEKLTNISGVCTALPHYEGQGLVRYSGDMRGIKIRGVVPDLLQRDKDFTTKFKMLEGEFDLTKRNRIVLGEVLAKQLGVHRGDRLSIFVPPSGGGMDMLLPLNMEYVVAGIFSSGFSEYDEFFVFMSLRDAQLLFNAGDTAYAIGVKLDNPEHAPRLQRIIKQKLGYRYLVFTWMQLRRNLYQALVTEKTLIAVVLFFVILMAAFSIASTLIMVVMEKEREIGILKSIGMTPASVRRVFLTQGIMVGLAGTLIGLISGLFIASSMDNLMLLIEQGVNFFQDSYHALFGDLLGMTAPDPWKLFPQDVYYVSTFPVKINPFEVFIVCIGSVLMTTLCSFIPARQAARLSVTEVLHKE